jgi:hypothetical protein
MKGQYKIALYYILIFSFFGCATKRETCKNCGLIALKLREYNKDSAKYISLPQFRDRVSWYKDSFVIQEVDHIYQENDTKGNYRFTVIVERYKFIDLRTREIFEYRNFSDTASIIKKCAPDDSSCIRETWRFWDKPDNMQEGTLRTIGDTTLDGITYKRVENKRTVQTEKGELEFYQVGYFRCDLRKPIFTFNPALTKKFGCPMVRFDAFYVPDAYSLEYVELEYFPRKLTPEELKVFVAWERNAKNYKTQ